ncbi:MAG: hypothetical protein IPK50_14440 [Fibrobacterota bacterium]|nr:hypothetical protein [Fibrobacterota bacterium]QQS03495.1 MAG: hypothetical protein IPK50_14440 [Fibrobacterota bacterium]
MEVEFHANMSDSATYHVSRALGPVLEPLGVQLSGEYGGVMEHLWIDLELVESHAKPDGKPRHPFRLQKRVSGVAPFGLPPMPDQFNVGHFSVRPDFKRIASLPVEEAVAYALSLIYQSLDILQEKKKKLGGFDAQLFRERFKTTCETLGYPCGA